MSGYNVKRGRSLLNTPGPTNVPEQVQQAMVRNPLDLGDPRALSMIETCFRDLKKIFKTEHEIFMYAANGHGAWEAALVNTMSPGDLLLVPELGNFSTGWGEMAEALQMRTETIKGDWRQAIDPAKIRDRLAADKNHEIKGVLVIQTDTATSVTCDVPAIRKAIDESGHPALLFVDTIPTLAVTDFRMDEWGVDVAVSASQKGLMMPPGLGFVAASPKALEAHKKATSQRRYWDWSLRLAAESYRTFCGTSPQIQLYGLRASLDMLLEEGLENVFARHKRLARATRIAVEHWGQAGAMELNAINPDQYADGVTTILLKEGYDGTKIRDVCRDELQCALGGGLRNLSGKAFRIGHMGDMNEPMLYGALASVEATFAYLGVPYTPGGVTKAIEYLVECRKRGGKA
ncbi:aminotransferase class V-fold PLP-dependent enzyme [uncultured Nisaea sp.]|uniref:pyridoxal-phosphate-dependent aminotransferase family protein n=1 Tax=uncultured Nisaea sp. TaxID=538215 RepID=UPI0030ECFC5D|tara:strand:+ start:4459 stop:5667 length:1209 start_codon:yes stop_codon:yes gene_type:complete